MSKDDVKNILEKVKSIHPYKISGDRDSFLPYAEGWSDACAMIESLIEQLPKNKLYE